MEVAMSASFNSLGLDAETDEFLTAMLLSMKGRKKIMRQTRQTEAQWLETMRGLLKKGAVVIEQSSSGEFRLKPALGLTVINPH